MSVLEAQKGMTDLVQANSECGADLPTYSWGQNDDEVVIRVPVPPGSKAKQVDCEISPKSLRVGLKSQPAILSGPLFSSVKAEASFWSLEDSCRIVITLTKANIKHEEWWPHVVLGERQIDMKSLRPPAKHLRDLDSGAQAQVSKMMFDQNQKRLGLPTSDELKMQEMMKNYSPHV